MLEVVYYDDYLVAINKPRGLLVHRSPIDRHETRFALQLVRDQIGRRVYPVHRLDKPTSGVLLFALTSELAARLSQQFSEKTVQKQYLAIVRGYAPESGTIDYPLKEQEDSRIAGARAVQDAVTRFRCLAKVELPIAVDRYPQTRYSLLELFPETGRRHQLRRHMKHIAHPIIGDAKHGKGVHNRFFQNHFACHRLLLACVSLRCTHPVSGESVVFRARLDEDFSSIIRALGWEAQAASHLS